MGLIEGVWASWLLQRKQDLRNITDEKTTLPIRVLVVMPTLTVIGEFGMNHFCNTIAQR